jgi:ATP-dependent Zn protease
MMQALQQRGVQVWFKETSPQTWASSILNLGPIVLLVALWFFMIREKRSRRVESQGSPTYIPPQESKTRFGP